jgi:hypothetical protein
MTLLTRDQILAVTAVDTEDVAVPEWGGVVRVKALNGTERDQFEASMIGKDFTNVRARLVALACVGEDGKRLFSDKDVFALGLKSGKALQRVFSAAQRLAGLLPEDIDALTENFTSDPNADSISS